jgi:signal transduction histidine kinase
VVSLVRWPILGRWLRDHGRREQIDRLTVGMASVERRIAAYREISERILHTPPSSSATAAPRMIYDQYSDTPFVLFYGWTDDGRTGVALQLEQRHLLAEFLTTRALQRYRRHITITDGSGGWVAGARRVRSPIVLDLPFTRTLTHLRVGLREEAVFDRQDRLSDQWVTPLAIIAMFFVLGMAALVGQARAARQQAILLQRQRDFTTRVTHELKTPLAGIRLMAENIELGAYRGEPQLRDMAQRIMEEADRLSERVNEVLSVSRDRSIPDPEPFDPEEAVLEAVDQWGPRMEAAGVRLVADLHPTAEVMGDGAAVRDAVSCLLDNALKYRSEERASEVLLELQQHGSWVELSVADNGLGVPAEMRASIFERFVRVEGPNRGKAGGHGLGLAQVLSIAEKHRGTALCAEGIDGGAKFTLRLPALPG